MPLPVIAGFAALISSLASGIGAAIAYFASKFTKQILLLAAYATGVLVVVNIAIDIFVSAIGSQIAFPSEILGLYNVFMPENFASVITTIVSVEISLFTYRIILNVAAKYIHVLGS